MRIQIAFLLSICSLAINGFSQGNYALINRDVYHLIDRYQLMNDNGVSLLHTSFKPYRQSDIVSLLAATDSVSSKSDRWNYDYLRAENRFYVSDSISKSDKPFLKHFYNYKNDAYSVYEEDFKLSINPVLYLSGGKEKDVDAIRYINSRGVEVDGVIDGKVGFYAYMVENQASFPSYVSERIFGFGAVPGENFWKRFKDTGVDYFSAKGYVTLQATKHIGVQFGYDKNFIGNGYRSLILSDYSGNYTFLKLQTKVWKFQYTNLFAEMNADILNDNANVPLGNTVYPKKFLALHHLSLNVTKRLNIGVFESVVYGRDNNAFDVNYLNPVIFYRAIEGNLGSDGNVVLGSDWNWRAAKNFSLYGQLIIDEFKINEFKNGTGWWANKYGVQGGAKYINAFGVSNLDLQGEVNIVRPYTYSHRDKATSYSHYNQPLAHPFGANFKEAVGIVRYQPLPRLSFTGKMIVAQQGLDTLNGILNYDENTAATNSGGNVLIPNNVNVTLRGNFLGQGVSSKLFIMELISTYQVKHNLFLDLQLLYRKQTIELPLLSSNTTFAQFSFRWNIPFRTQNF